MGYYTAEPLTQVILRLLVILASLLDLTTAKSGELSNCKHDLGMQTGAIADDAVRASSSYDEASVGPQNGRIHTERNGGAWCPRNQITKDIYEWIEIDFRSLKLVTQVETQGRFGNGQGQEFAEYYILEYQREENGAWRRFRDKRKEEIFHGNQNTYMAVLREIRPAIVARKIRIIPHSTHPRTVCMRVELYGCDWTDGIVSYNTRQGDRRGAEVDLYDFTYDGDVRDNYLSGGLGQLTDREEGQSNFRLDHGSTGRKGFEWVGWKNETADTPPVDLLFEFNSVRNFSSVRFHTNNMFTKDVRVFRMAKLYFSIGGKYFLNQPVVYNFMRDTLMEYSRPVIIPAQHRIGKFVKVELYFDARWILLSEIKFESVPAVGNYTKEIVPVTTSPDFPTDANGRPRYVPIEDFPGQHTSVGQDGKVGDSREGDIVNTGTESDDVNDQTIGIIVGAIGAALVLLVVIVLFVVVRHRKNKSSTTTSNVKTEPHHVTLDLNDLRLMTGSLPVNPIQLTNIPPKVSNGNMYNSIATYDAESDREVQEITAKAVNGDMYREPLDAIQARKLPEVPECDLGTWSARASDTNTSRDYAVPDVTASSFLIPNGDGTFAAAPAPAEPLAPAPVSHPRAVYSGVDMATLQGFSGNSLYAVPTNMELMWKEDLAVMEFPRENLIFKEKLGEGQFGEVHLCEASRVTDFLGDDFLVNRTGVGRSLLVACKILRRDADDAARCDFYKEVKIMGRLKDPNIVRVLGVCTQDEPLCVIVEYMKFGDLNQFLQQHLPLESTMPRKKSAKCLSYGCLIYMATQIASGMKYLETLNMVHRDLASRNCLVGSYYTIKISDFGMSRSLYSSDYYRIEGKAVLPIRWMAWESILLGKFSTKSDVWSFGVTLWEVLTFAQEQPYAEFTDEQVIESAGHCYRGDGLEACLPQPHNCPKEIFDLVRECWNRDETCRPAFREIHMFMQRKNMGYNPRDERNANSTLNRITVPVV